MLIVQLVDLVIVLADKQSLQRCQVGIFLCPHVPRSKGRSVRGHDDGQIVAGRNFHVPIRIAQTGCGGRIGTIHLGTIEPTGHRVDGCSGVSSHTGRRIDRHPRAPSFR